MNETQSVGIEIHGGGSLQHQAPNGVVSKLQAPQLLLHQVRRLTAQYSAGSTHMRLDLVEEAARIYRSLRGRFREPRMLCDLANNEGLALLRGPDPERSIERFLEADRWAQEGALPPLYRCAVLHNLAQAHDLMGRVPERERYLREEREHLAAHLPAAHPVRIARERDAQALNQTGTWRERAGSDSEAKAVEAWYGLSHPASALAWHNRGVALASGRPDRRRLVEAERCLSRALRIRTRIQPGLASDHEILRTRLERMECRARIPTAGHRVLFRQLLPLAQDCSDFWGRPLPVRIWASLDRSKSILDKIRP